MVKRGTGLKLGKLEKDFSKIEKDLDKMGQTINKDLDKTATKAGKSVEKFLQIGK